MKIRKCLHKVVAPPHCIAQWLGVVLIDERLMSMYFDHLCLTSSLPQWAGTTSISLNSTNHIYLPLFPTNLAHGITHVSRIHDNMMMTFILERIKHEITQCIFNLVTVCSFLLFISSSVLPPYVLANNL
jgi:hypothetical protein